MNKLLQASLACNEEQTTSRAFIAVEITTGIRAGLAKIQLELQKANGHVSWVQPENIHCTLVFLGDIFANTVDAITAALNRTTADCKPFEIEIAGLGFFGSARSPRIIWAGMAGQTDVLINLHGKITAAVLQAGLKPDEKPFKPHLTIGRVRSNRNAASLVSAIIQNKDKTFGALSVQRVVLMKSEAPCGPDSKRSGRGNLLRRSSLGYAGRVFAEPCDLSGEALAKTEAKNAILSSIATSAKKGQLTSNGPEYTILKTVMLNAC